MRKSLKILLLACTSLVAFDASAARFSEIKELRATVAQQQSEISSLNSFVSVGLSPTPELLATAATAAEVLTKLPGVSLAGSNPLELLKAVPVGATGVAKTLDGFIKSVDNTYEAPEGSDIIARFPILHGAVGVLIAKHKSKATAAKDEAKAFDEKLFNIDTLIASTLEMGSDYTPSASTAVESLEKFIGIFQKAGDMLTAINRKAMGALRAEAEAEAEASVASHDEGLDESLPEQVALERSPLDAEQSVDALISELNAARTQAKQPSDGERALLSKIEHANNNAYYLAQHLGVTFDGRDYLSDELHSRMMIRISELMQIEALSRVPAEGQAEGGSTSNLASSVLTRRLQPARPISDPVPASSEPTLLGSVLNLFGPAAPAAAAPSAPQPAATAPAPDETTAGPSALQVPATPTPTPPAPRDALRVPEFRSLDSDEEA